MVVALVHAILFRKEQTTIWGGRTSQLDADDVVDEDRTPLLTRTEDVY
jgi:hypothetical protein